MEIWQKVSDDSSKRAEHVPVSVCGDDIVDPKLLTDLLDPKVKSVSFKLLSSHVGHDHGGQAHQARRFIFLCVTPSIALLAPLGRVSCNICSVMSAKSDME